jgi:hypothetical protein
MFSPMLCDWQFTHMQWRLPERLAQAVRLMIYFWDMPASNTDRESDYQVSDIS